MTDVVGGALVARADYAGFDDFWEREACRAELPEGPFSLEARAWCARGTAVA